MEQVERIRYRMMALNAILLIATILSLIAASQQWAGGIRYTGMSLGICVVVLIYTKLNRWMQNHHRRATALLAGYLTLLCCLGVVVSLGVGQQSSTNLSKVEMPVAVDLATALSSGGGFVRMPERFASDGDAVFVVPTDNEGNYADLGKSKLGDAHDTILALWPHNTIATARSKVVWHNGQPYRHYSWWRVH